MHPSVHRPSPAQARVGHLRRYLQLSKEEKEELNFCSTGNHDRPIPYLRPLPRTKACPKPLPLTELKFPNLESWNELFQQLLETPPGNEAQSLQLAEQADVLMQEFLGCVTAVVSKFVGEINLPLDKRTFKAQNLGVCWAWCRQG